MPLLFLDIDGVLNSAAFFDAKSRNQWKKALALRKSHEDYDRFHLEMIDSLAVVHLSEVYDQTKCNIVISSSWRAGDHYSVIERWLIEQGFTGPKGTVIGSTPMYSNCPEDCPGSKNEDSQRYCNRGHQIQAWLDNHPTAQKFGIIDDGNDMAHLNKYLVQTTWSHGMQEHHAMALIHLLGKAK